MGFITSSTVFSKVKVVTYEKANNSVVTVFLNKSFRMTQVTVQCYLHLRFVQQYEKYSDSLVVFGKRCNIDVGWWPRLQY